MDINFGLLIIFVSLVNGISCISISVTSDDFGAYNVSINDVAWLQSAPTFVNENGTKLTTEDGSLNLTKSQTTFNGTDAIGDFIVQQFEYSGTLQVNIKEYNDYPFLVFEQFYLMDVHNTKNSICPRPQFPPVPNLGTCFNETVSGFPSFLVKQPADVTLGFFSLGGKMLGDFGKTMGRFAESDVGDIADGMRSGPLVLFDETGTAVLISPLDQFMTTSMWYESAPSPRLSWGIMGGVNNIPAKYSSSVILVAATGINSAFDIYGRLLRKIYNTDIKRTTEIHKDLTVHYLGYWTDNGAYYYYNPEVNKTYEDTLLDVKQYSIKNDVPYRYLQLDSWWYYKNKRTDALVDWTARPDTIPNGIRNLSQSTKWKIAAHNRYWSNDNVYDLHNGGHYNFVKEYILSIPDDQIFWNDLFYNGTKWGLILYEQDWLNIQTLFTAALQTDLHLGEAWLTQMGNAARINNISLQYCMALPRHALQSVKVPQVTQVRVSEDYLLEPTQWKIGISSIFASALSVRPYKDTFWTSRNESGNPRYNDKTEPSPALQSLVSTLSTGPVGPGDKIGMVNKTILMRCCRSDGLILKPSKPATAIDRQIIKTALPTADGPQGEVWTTYSTINGLPDTLFGIILAADLKAPYNLHIKETGFSKKDAIVVSYKDPMKWSNLNSNRTLLLDGCAISDFCLYFVTTPIHLKSGTTVYILGELTKWTPVSPQRITSTTLSKDTLLVHLNGTVSETVPFTFIVNNTIDTISCTGLEKGNVYIDVVEKRCSNWRVPNGGNGGNPTIINRLTVFVCVLAYLMNNFVG